MSRILVIDDSALILDLLEEFLTGHGFDVTRAPDASSGYEQAVRLKPDLILLDVQLPDVAGFELLRTLRSRPDLRHIPVIMITATAQSTDEKVAAFQSGADDYVLKPFAMPELLERIRIQLRKRAAASTNENAGDISPVPDASPVSTAAASRRPTSLRLALVQALLEPGAIQQPGAVEGAAAFSLTCLLLTSQGALWMSRGTEPRTAVAAMAVAGIWLLAWAILTVLSSLVGSPFRWREAARLIALAGTPLLLQSVGALVFSAWTTLSPTHFSASALLFWPAAPTFLGRVGLFELWSLALLYRLLMQQPSLGRGKSAFLALTVFLAVVLALFAAERGAGG